MENRKPISEWTLKEVQEMCDNRGKCTECTFYDSGNCEVCRVPVEWPLGKAEAVTGTVEYTHYPAAATEATEKPAKPRLAEILGVEEDEKWDYPGLYGPYRIHNGIREALSSSGTWYNCGNEESLTEIINHPEKIIRSPRLTEAELAICKAVGAKWVSKNKYGARRVTLWDAKPIFDEGMFSIPEDDEHSVTIGVIGRISDVLFPSVKPGDCIEVEAKNAKVQ